MRLVFNDGHLTTRKWRRGAFKLSETIGGILESAKKQGVIAFELSYLMKCPVSIKIAAGA